MRAPPDSVDVRWTPHGFEASVTRTTGMPRTFRRSVFAGVMVPMLVAVAVVGFNWRILSIVFATLIATSMLVTAYLLRFHRPAPLQVSVLHGRLRIGMDVPIELEPGMRLGKFDEAYVNGMHLWTRDGEIRTFIELIALDMDAKAWLREALDSALRDVVEVEAVPQNLQELRRSQLNSAGQQTEKSSHGPPRRPRTADGT